MAMIDSGRGRIALMVAHCAGMVDLVALPVWVGALMQHAGLDAQQAGGLVTLFLAGAVLASVVLAPRLRRLPGRAVVAGGFALAANCFALLAGGVPLAGMAGLHALAGLAAGAALSVTHGTIALGSNPHRLFAIVGMALGVFAVVFLGVAPPLVQSQGTGMLFGLFGGIMAAASLVAALAFPRPEAQPSGAAIHEAASMPREVWLGIVGVCGMALVQAMTFSFLERAGHARGFEPAAIAGVLVALGFVNLLPAALAAALQRRWSAHSVLVGGAALQAVLAATIMTAASFWPFAIAGSLLAAVMIFTHTFAFGLLARLDTSGRALAATPAMVMIGAAIGPVLGGTLVNAFGYPSIAVAALGVGSVALVCFLRLRQARTASPAPAPASP